MRTPADMPATLHAIKDDIDQLDAPLRHSITEVDVVMRHYLDQGYSPAEAIQLTDLTLSNVLEAP